MVKRTNLKKLREMYEKSIRGSTNFSDIIWKPSDGENIIRILPPATEDEVFYVEAGTHNFGGYFFWCPRASTDKALRCPICEEVRRRYNSGSELDIEIAQKLKLRRVYLYNIIDRKAEDPTEVKIYISGKKVWQKIMSYYFDEEYGALDDVDKGYDFKLIKNSLGDFPNYDDSRPFTKPSPLAESEKKIAEILSNAHNLQEFIRIEPAEKLESALVNFLEEFYSEEPKIKIKGAVEKPRVKPEEAVQSDSTSEEVQKIETDVEDETEDDIEDFEEFQRKLEEALAEDDED